MRFAILFIILFYFLSVSSQDTNTFVSDSLKFQYFYLKDDLSGRQIIEIDTIDKFAHKFDIINVDNNRYATLSNTGQAHYDLIFKNYNQIGFSPYLKSFTKYFDKKNNVRIYDNVSPYTHILYVMGGKKEQDLSFRHAQMIASGISLGINYRLSDSPGYYNNTRSENKNFDLNLKISSKNNKYEMIVYYIHNKLNLLENGGLKDINSFLDDKTSVRENIDVFLDGAENHVKSNEYFLEQSYSFIKTDSIDRKFFFGINSGRLVHNIRYHKNRLWYLDKISDSLFYNNTYNKDLDTYDSLNIFLLENNLYWTNVRTEEFQKFIFEAGIKHQYYQWQNYFYDSLLMVNKQSMISPFVKGRCWINENWNIDFNYTHAFGGLYNNNFSIQWGSNLKTKIGDIQYNGEMLNNAVNWMLTSFHSNHFIWDNSFENIKSQKHRVSINAYDIDASIRFENISSYVYLDSMAIPVQNEGSLQFFQVNFHREFNLLNFIFIPEVNYQSSSNREVLPLPEFIGELTFAYQNSVFKEAATITTGIEAYYYTKYHAPAYMPALRSFYNQISVETGGFYMADFFFNFKVKRARLFVKYENLASIAQIYNYVAIPNYPLRDGRVAFGVFWMFYD